MKVTDFGVAVVERDTHIGKWVQEHKRLDFDQNTLPYIMEFIKPGDVVVDVGANIGAYAYAFAKKASIVYCFEPNTECFECLLFNMKGLDNVEIFKVALGGIVCHGTPVVENNNMGMAYMRVESDGQVNINPLDCYSFSKVDFIKIDCEGMELGVLKGAQHTITKFHPTMYIEINDYTLERNGLTKHDIFNFLNENGYTYRNIYPNQEMNDSQFDIICTWER